MPMGMGEVITDRVLRGVSVASLLSIVISLSETIPVPPSDGTVLGNILNAFDTPKKVTEEFINTRHFSEPNILAHLRIKDYVDSEGNKVMVIQEVQSDWHQAGRKNGYQTPKGSSLKDVLDA